MKNLEAEIRTYLEERNWNALRPGDVAKSISIEASELLEIFQWENPELEQVKGDAKKLDQVKSELADVLIYCLDMAVLLELDTEALVKEKLDYIRTKYPAELFAGKEGGTTPGTEDVYLRIKHEYRKQGKS